MFRVGDDDDDDGDGGIPRPRGHGAERRRRAAGDDLVGGGRAVRPRRRGPAAAAADGDEDDDDGGLVRPPDRRLHFDPDEPQREDDEDFVVCPVESMRWLAKDCYQAQLPLNDYCYMCLLRQEPDNPFYVTLQAIANAPTLDEEARCVHIARVYAKVMQDASGERLPDWKELAVHRHLTKHDISQRRVLHNAVVRSSDILDAYGATMMRYKRDSSGDMVMLPPDNAAVKAMVTLHNFQRLAAQQLAALGNT
jgi:hypothetical protein